MKYKKISWLQNQVRHDIKLSVFLAGLLGMVSAANIAYIPKAAAGNTATAGAGKEWPATRFVVSGNCVTDNLTGLMWAKNSTLLGQTISWSGAKSMVATMNTSKNATGYHLCGYSDWRLPNINELKSLVNYTATQNSSNPAAWLKTQGFINVQTSGYWSSTPSDDRAWVVDMYKGSSIEFPSFGNSLYVWPVRGGQ